MSNVWAQASLWVGLALIATLLAIWFKISTALTGSTAEKVLRYAHCPVMVVR